MTSAKDIKKMKEKVKALVNKVSAEVFEGQQLTLECACDPGSLRGLEQLVLETKGRATLEVISLKDVRNDDVEF